MTLSPESIPFSPAEPEAYAQAVFDFPYELQAWLTHPGRERWPAGQYEGIVAAQQLRALADPREAEVLGRCLPDIAATLDGPRWQMVRTRVATGYPNSVDLQLMLFAATGANVHFKRRGRLAEFWRDRDAPGASFLDLLPAAVSHEQDRRALRDYVDNKYVFTQTIQEKNKPPRKERVHFNDNAPHVPLVAYLDFMRKLDLMDLDVTEDNPVRDSLIQQVSSTFDSVRGSGEYRLLPAYMWWQVHALKAFAEDRQHYVSGNTQLAAMRGRQWQSLTGEGAQDEFNKYLLGREAAARTSDALFMRWSPQPVNTLRQEFLQASLRGDNELAGILWGVLLERRLLDVDGAEARQAVHDLSQDAKEHLEPYVLEGLQLIADRRAPYWLRVVVFESWMHTDREASVFTDAFGSVASDRSAAGAALATAIAGKTAPYGSFRPEVALATAYRLRDTCAPTNLLGREVGTRRMRQLLPYFEKFRNNDNRRLAPEVHTAYEMIRRTTPRLPLA